MSFSNANVATLQEESNPLITDVQFKPNQTKPNQTKPNQIKQNKKNKIIKKLLEDEEIDLVVAEEDSYMLRQKEFTKMVMTRQAQMDIEARDAENKRRELEKMREQEQQDLEVEVDDKESEENDYYVQQFEEFQRVIAAKRDRKLRDRDNSSSGSDTDEDSKFRFAERVGQKFLNSLATKKEDVDEALVLADVAREVKSEIQRKRDHRTVMFKEMRDLLPQLKKGASVTSVRKSDGKKLSYEERSAILRILPKEFDPYKSGRFRKYCGEGRFQDTHYMCNLNLAGRFYICTTDGVITPVSIMGKDVECGHKTCAFDREIRSGGESDKLVLVIPEIYSDCNRGILSDQKAGRLKFWQDNYHEAVVATNLMMSTMTPEEVHKILGNQYVPTSKFCTVMVFMTRMLGLKNVGFLKYTPNKTMFDNMLEGVRGAPDKFAAFWTEKGKNHRQPTPKASWPLHELCKLKFLHPEVSIPFRYYLENLTELTVKGESTMLALCNAFESSQDIKEALSLPVDMSDQTEVSVQEIDHALVCKVDGKIQELTNTAATVFHGRLRNIVPDGVFDLTTFEVKSMNCASPYHYDSLLAGKSIKYKKLLRGKWIQKEVVGLAGIPEESIISPTEPFVGSDDEILVKPLKEYSDHESLIMMLRNFKPSTARN